VLSFPVFTCFSPHSFGIAWHLSFISIPPPLHPFFPHRVCQVFASSPKLIHNHVFHWNGVFIEAEIHHTLSALAGGSLSSDSNRGGCNMRVASKRSIHRADPFSRQREMRHGICRVKHKETRSFRRRSSTLMVNGGAAGLVTALLAARDCFGQAYPGQLIAEAFKPKHSSEDGTALPQSQYPKCLVSGNFAGRAHSIGNPDSSSCS
jgi:hypothetical protein